MPRPTKMTKDVIQKLERAFLFGCSDREACSFVGIAQSTLYDYCQKNKEFSDRKEVLKHSPSMKAKAIIYKALEDGDLPTAHKVIDRVEGKKLKAEINGNLTMSHVQMLEKLA